MKKKIFISADIEGCAGVTAWDELAAGGKGYEEAARQMTLETAAACQACIDAGYDVVVKDGHEDARNIDGNQLPRGVQLIRGWMVSPYGMMGGLDESYAGVIYIGYHARAGSNRSPLRHTIEDYYFNWVTLNGEYASEFTLNSILSDEMGVPSLFLSGDKACCEEAEAEYPGLKTVSVKEGVGNATWSMHPQDAVDAIYQGVTEALKDPAPLRPLAEEYDLVMNFREYQKVRKAAWYPGVRVIDEHTVSYTARKPLDLMVGKMFILE